MCLYCTERRGWVWIRPALTADVSALWDEGETAMKSAGTTGYYQDSSRGSARASEPAGREGRRREEREEHDRGGEPTGLTRPETTKTVPRREKTRNGGGCEGQRQNVGKCKHFIISSAVFPQLQVSQICPIPRLTPALHSSNGEALD